MNQTVSKRRIASAIFIALLVGIGAVVFVGRRATSDADRAHAGQPARGPEADESPTFLIAGGCFWCVEHDLEKVAGVIDVVSGYSGGTTKNPTYENYAEGGHREVVRVAYDPQKVSEFGLLVYALKHMDPTDGTGSFNDRGEQYSPALYYRTDDEKKTAEAALEYIRNQNVFDKELQVPVLKRESFWPAEEYHQDYAKNSSFKYSYYRRASGRDRFIEEHWGQDKAEVVPEKPASLPDLAAEVDASSTASKAARYAAYEKPGRDQLRSRLTPIEYRVTQEEGTEKPFDNPLWDNTEPGIYVDILSGEPLFSSTDKYKSGTGWPSFTQPLERDLIILKDDWKLFVKRTEVRSKYGDNHIGHVFQDGPETVEASGGAEPTGLRWCMNSAALTFIHKDELEEKGYGDYLRLFEAQE